jgi:hypothetical protein
MEFITGNDVDNSNQYQISPPMTHRQEVDAPLSKSIEWFSGCFCDNCYLIATDGVYQSAALYDRFGSDKNEVNLCSRIDLW